VRGAAGAAVVSGAVFALAATNRWLRRETWSPLFPNGDLQVPRPRLLGIDFAPQQNFALLLAVVFAALGVGLVALRRGAYGRRLTAMKNSPAACATLGMSVVRLKLSVFMLSAAIAGLGGCLFAMEIGAVTSDRFSLFESMTILMLLVVAGTGYVAGGLTAGLLYAAAFVALGNILTRLGHDYTAFQGWTNWLGQFTALLPALIGIALGRDPSGFLGDSFRTWAPMIRRRRPLFFVGVAVGLGMWLLTWRAVIGKWPFAIATIALAVLLPRVAPLVDRELREPVTGADDVPLELVGIERPFTTADLRTIDTALGLEGARA
jgi:branched-subunit amino acid ABC-type transport system permease component